MCACVCVIFCLFDSDEPALLLHMLNVSLYYAITILILPQVSFIWLNKIWDTRIYKGSQRIRQIRCMQERSNVARSEKKESVQNMLLFIRRDTFLLYVLFLFWSAYVCVSVRLIVAFCSVEIVGIKGILLKRNALFLIAEKNRQIFNLNECMKWSTIK